MKEGSYYVLTCRRLVGPGERRPKSGGIYEFDAGDLCICRSIEKATLYQGPGIYAFVEPLRTTGMQVAFWIGLSHDTPYYLKEASPLEVLATVA